MKGKVFLLRKICIRIKRKSFLIFIKMRQKNSVARRRIRKGDGRIKEFVDYECYG